MNGGSTVTSWSHVMNAFYENHAELYSVCSGNASGLSSIFRVYFNLQYGPAIITHI